MLTKGTKSLRALTDLLMLVGGQISSKVLGFVAFAYLARVLSADDYGGVEIVMGMAAIGLACIEFGTGTIGARQIARDGVPPDKVARSVVSARILMAIAVLPLLVGVYLALTLAQVSIWLTLLVASGVMFGVLKHDWLFQAVERMHIAAFGVSIKMLVFFGAVLVLAPGRNGVVYVGLAELIAMAAMACFFLTSQVTMIGSKKPWFSLASGWSLTVSSSPLGLSAMVKTIGAALPVLIVGAVVGTADAGQFGAALRIVVSIQAFSWVYYFNLFPLISRSRQSDIPYLEQLIAASENFIIWTTLSGALLVTIAATPIMGIVFGAGYTQAGTYLAVLIWIVPLSLMSGTGRWLLIAQDRQKQVFRLELISILVGLTSTIILIGVFGAIVATWGLVATGCISWLLAHLYSQSGAVRPQIRAFILPLLLVGSLLVSFNFLSAPVAVKFAVALLVMSIGALMGSKFVDSCKLLARSKADRT